MRKSEKQQELERLIVENPVRAFFKVRISPSAQIAEVGNLTWCGIKTLGVGLICTVAGVIEAAATLVSLLIWPLTRLVLFCALRDEIMEDPEGNVLERVDTERNDEK